MLEIPITTKVLPLLLAGWLSLTGVIIPFPQRYEVIEYPHGNNYTVMENNVEIHIGKDIVEINTIMVKHKDGTFIWDKWEHNFDISEYLSKEELDIIDKWEGKVDRLRSAIEIEKFKETLKKKSQKEVK